MPVEEQLLMMPGRVKDKKARLSAETRNDAVYVYCIGERAGLADLIEARMPESIEAGSQLYLVESGKLGAIVSDVPLADYGADAFQSRLVDPRWTAVRAMRHENVVEHFASRTDVIPLRFGTIFLRRDRVRRLLADKQAGLLKIIWHVRGRQEWGLNIYKDRAKLLKAITLLSPKLRELNERASSAAPGKSYLLQKMMDSMRNNEVRIETERVIDEIHGELSRLSEGMSRLRVLKDDATEHGAVAAKMAFLVDRKLFNKFRQAAERLAAKHAVSGFKLEITGPWPAYNFATIVESVDRGTGPSHGKKRPSRS